MKHDQAVSMDKLVHKSITTVAVASAQTTILVLRLYARTPLATSIAQRPTPTKVFDWFGVMIKLDPTVSRREQYVVANQTNDSLLDTKGRAKPNGKVAHNVVSMLALAQYRYLHQYLLSAST